MIKVSVFYPNSDGTKFNHDYYANTHMPMVKGKLGGALKGSGIDKGLGGGTPDAPAPYHAIGHLMFDSVEDFQGAFGPNAQEIMSDIPNYTDAEPVIQVSEIVA